MWETVRENLMSTLWSGFAGHFLFTFLCQSQPLSGIFWKLQISSRGIKAPKCEPLHMALWGSQPMMNASVDALQMSWLLGDSLSVSDVGEFLHLKECFN